MATGTIHKLGTLYIDGKIIPRSTKPWPSSASVQPSEGNLFQLPIYGYGKKPTIRNKRYGCNRNESDTMG